MTAMCSEPGLSMLADMLSLGLETPVLDATGLKGAFYYSFRSQFRILPAAVSALGAHLPESDPNLPSLATALEEQLGLRLESRRGPVDVLVIDSVEPPTEN
jgi:uncharacterized protein (TIGR03435 family)